MKTLERQVREAIRRFALLFPGDRVLCCLSGGADSVAMTRVLVDLAPETDVFVACAHLNHSLRGEESDGDEAFVRGYCRDTDLPLYTERIDVAGYCRDRGVGLEAGAREVRYDFFDRAARELGCNRIATAHTADDNLETVLFHLARGSGTLGLAGIPPVRGPYIRPLILADRRAVEEYLSELDLGYREDSSNLSFNFARNRIRHQVVPALRTINPAVAAAVSNASQALRLDEEALCAEAEAFIQQAGLANSALAVSLLLSAKKAVAYRAIRDTARGAGVPALSARHMTALFSLLESPVPSARLSLPGGFEARREYDALIFQRPLEPPPPLTTRVLVPGDEAVLAGTGLMIRCFWQDGPAENGPGRISIPESELAPPLLIRPRQAGDRVILPGGSKSLKKWLIDQKIPKDQRDSLPIVADTKGVIAVPGYFVNPPRSAQTGGRVLSIEWRIIEE